MLRTVKQSKTKVKPMLMDFVRYGSLRPQRHDSARLPADHKDRWFHTAPTVWGFYAFPHAYECHYLLIAKNPTRLRMSNRLHWIKDEQGNRVKFDDSFSPEYHGHFSEPRTKQEMRLRKINGLRTNYTYIMKWDVADKNKDYAYTYGLPHKFKYGGDIWHHLECYRYVVYKYDSIYHLPKDCVSRVEKVIRIVEERDIIARSGTWVKTSMRTYRKALKKYTDYLRNYGFLRGITSDTVAERRLKNDCLSTGIDGREKAFFEVYVEKL